MKYHALSRFAIDLGGGARQTKGAHLWERDLCENKKSCLPCAPESLAYDNTAHKVRVLEKREIQDYAEKARDESCTRWGSQSVSRFLSPCSESSPRLPFRD